MPENVDRFDDYGRTIRPVIVFNTNKDGSGTPYFGLCDSSGRPMVVIEAGTQVIGKVNDDFGGNIYSKTMTMGDNNATRFETSTKKLRDVIILVETFGMLLGKTGTEVLTVNAGGAVGFTKVDISTLYFKNAGAGSNGKITILGVEE